MPFAPLDPPRAGLHYRLSGAFGAPWLVFVNSLATDLRLWDDVIARIGGRYRVLTWDLRGHGLSDTPAGPWRIADLTDDLLALLEHQRIARFALCGLSVGGLVAQDVAARAPQRVAALVLSNTGLRIGAPDVWETRMEAVRSGGMAAVVDATMARWFTPAFRADRARLAPWHHMVARTPPEGFLHTAAAIRDADMTAAAAAISAPTLVIGGAEDGGTPPDLARALAAAVPAAALEIMPDVAHLPCVEDADAYAVRLTSFLREAGVG
jgi:3-oxoadipate enol-lactonase